jgi:hypothetical protein
MPDGASPRSEIMLPFRTARAQIAAWLFQSAGGMRPLTAGEIAEYPDRGFAAGWRFPVQFNDAERRLDVLLPAGFPWQPPRIALVERPRFLTWPHVERDGVLCLAPNTLSIDPENGLGVTQSMLGAAVALINSLVAGGSEADFRDEFLSYWSFAESESGPTLISLLPPEPPTRLIRLWREKGSYVLAEADVEIEHWLVNRFGKKPDGFVTESAALFWQDAAPVPAEYPSCGQHLLTSVSRTSTEAGRLLSDLARSCPARVTTVLGFQTVNGPALAGVIVPAPAATKHGPKNPLTKGFRPGQVPDAVLLGRYFGSGPAIRRSIERADASWIHGRDQDQR